MLQVEARGLYDFHGIVPNIQPLTCLLCMSRQTDGRTDCALCVNEDS